MNEVRYPGPNHKPNQTKDEVDYHEILAIREKGPKAVRSIECVALPGIRWITSGYPDLETRNAHLRTLGIRFVEREEAERIRAEKRQALKQTIKEKE